MANRKVISAKNLPYRLPLMGALVWWLILDKFGAPDWAYGALAMLYAVVVLGVIHDMLTSKQIDLFKDSV